MYIVWSNLIISYDFKNTILIYNIFLFLTILRIIDFIINFCGIWSNNYGDYPLLLNFWNGSDYFYHLYIHAFWMALVHEADGEAYGKNYFI